MTSNIVLASAQLICLACALLLMTTWNRGCCVQISATAETAVSGPSFISLPPSSVDFSNSSGISIRCIATGYPVPTVQWIHKDDRPVTSVPSLRHVSPNGTLTFFAFRAEDYRQDIHATLYKCMATNSVGTIVSGTVRLRAVVNQVYEAQVYDEFVIMNNTAVLKCHIPSFVMDYVSVTAWIIDDTIEIDSSIETGARISLLPTGELVIVDVREEDAHSYRCRTIHRLNGQSKQSATAGRLIVTEPQGSVPPRWAIHRSSVTVDQGRTLVVPCVAQGYPTPSYSWSKRVGKTRAVPLTVDGHRVRQISGTLVIRFTNIGDAGVYICLVNNSVGVERMETSVTAAETLSVAIHPPSRVIQVGHTAEFTCVVTGHPVASVYWLKNGRPVTSSSTSTVSQSELLRVANAQKGDVGMYQCFAGNDLITAQAAAELKLGDSVPSIQTKFYEETYQPGASVSLSCSAYGNPSPKVEWNVDHQVLSGNTQRINVAAYWSAEGDAVSVLNISEVRTEDGGEYTCTARNHVGEASHSARLNIYGPPFVRRIPTVTTVSGRDVRLRCLYGGYPIEAISWEKDGTLLPIDFRQEVPTNGTLIVRRVQRLIDSGRYTCRVRSPMGQEAQQQVDVRIMIPPNIDGSTFLGHDVDEGSHARIICGVTDGDLPINFTWLRDGRSMSKDEAGVVVKNIDEFSNVLTIKNVMTSHIGKYTCVATNAAASTNRTTELKVRVPPKWRVEPADVKLVVGQSITLNCVADGFPMPVTSWMKVIGSVSTGPRQALSNDTRTSLFTNGSLNINNAQSEDEGYYFCITTNGIGPGLNKMIYINIKSPAKFDVHYRQEVARKGKEVSLVCQAQGEPPLFVTWEKEENDVSLFPHRYRVDNKKVNAGGVSFLRIESVRREDSGAFKCNVKNSYGHDSVTIHLMVLEPPDIPLHVKVVDYGSRKVKLSWSQPFDGNSPILKYRVEGKLSSAEWTDSMLLLSTPTASTTAAEVEGLLPATKYTFRVLAENEVGVGFPSESVNVVTEDEAPGAPPQDVHVRAIDSETLRVTWKPPPHSAWNGELLGYNVGFRPADASTKPYLYSSLELNNKRDSALSTDLKGLIKYTKYGVVVRAFNRVGLGPLSNEILETTAEDVPTESPQEVECSPINSESLQVAWKPPSPLSVNGVLQGYKIFYRLAEDWHDNVNGMEAKTTTSLRTSLHGLKKFSNYSVQVLAFTLVGDGVKSDPIYCSTLEDVPGSPGDIKALPLSLDTVLVTWKHPRYPHGILTKYSVYIRSIENAKESTTIESVSPVNTYYYWKKEMKDNGRYEFWVTASTSIGEGESTAVVNQRAPGSVVAARVASFGDIYVVRQSQDVELACLSVGIPPPTSQWTFKDLPVVTNDKWTIFENGSLIIREVINSDGGNYTCKVHNSYGVDSIVYALVVQEPPSPPQITISTATSDMINIKWRAEAGEMPLRGFIVHFKRDFGEWEEVNVPKDQNDFVLEGLDCGTRYHVYVSAKNDIGIGKPSQVTTIKTEGTAPIVPPKEKLITESSTYITLYLEAWRTGLECPILYFVVEHKKKENRTWTLVSNNVQPQHVQFVIPDLSAATWYNLRMTAHNTAGSTVAYYDFATLTAAGATIATIVAELGDSRALKSNEWTFYFYLSLSIGAVALVLGFGSVVACLLHNKRRRQTNAAQDEKAAKATYVPCNNTEKYERASTPTSFTYLMRNKDRPSSGSRQVSDTSTKVSEEDVCPYATFQISDRKSHAFNEELKTFGDRSPDKPVNVRCIKDPRGEGIYQKGNTLHPKYNCGNQVHERLHWAANPGEDLLMPAHLTESALELQISQNCENSHAEDCGELHVPDLLYHGVESGSSNEDSSPISTCSYELHQQRHHSKMINLDPRLRMNKPYGASFTMDETSAFLSLPRSSRQESYLMNHHDPRREMEIEDQVWFHNSSPDEYHHYNRHKSALLEMNPVDSSC